MITRSRTRPASVATPIAYRVTPYPANHAFWFSRGRDNRSIVKANCKTYNSIANKTIAHSIHAAYKIVRNKENILISIDSDFNFARNFTFPPAASSFSNKIVDSYPLFKFNLNFPHISAFPAHSYTYTHPFRHSRLTQLDLLIFKISS